MHAIRITNLSVIAAFKSSSVLLFAGRRDGPLPSTSTALVHPAYDTNVLHIESVRNVFTSTLELHFFFFYVQTVRLNNEAVEVLRIYCYELYAK